MKFSAHAIRQMFSRSISVDEVIVVIANPIVVETYPNDYPYPSRLLLGFPGGRPIHVVVAQGNTQSEPVIVTAYEPDPALWEADYIERKPR